MEVGARRCRPSHFDHHIVIEIEKYIDIRTSERLSQGYIMNGATWISGARIQPGSPDSGEKRHSGFLEPSDQNSRLLTQGLGQAGYTL